MKKTLALLLLIGVFLYLPKAEAFSISEHHSVLGRSVPTNAFQAPCDPALDIPEISIQAPTCTADGAATIVNYDPFLSYIFSPAGPTVNASGEIEGMIFGVSYTIVADIGTCTSLESVKVSINEMLPAPDVPTIGVVSPSCIKNGSAVIINYGQQYTYEFNPAGPVVDEEGNILDFDFSQQYTVTATSLDGCVSDPSLSFEVIEGITTPEISATVIHPTVCGGNGMINFSFVNVPNGTYSIDYDGGSFSVSVFNGEGTVSATAGIYENMVLVIEDCSSGVISVTLLDPNAPAVPNILTTIATCTSSSLSTIINYDENLNYTFSPAGPTILANGEIQGATFGVTYTLTVEESGCTSSINFTNQEQLIVPTLSVTSTEPSACGGNGAIYFETTEIVDGTYTINHDGGEFIVYVTAGAAHVYAPAGNYDNLTISNEDCTSALGVNAVISTISAPVSPIVEANELSCQGQENGTAQISNFISGYNYSFTPAGPSVTASGEIINALPGVNYTITAAINSCSSTATSFSILAWADGDCDNDGVSNGDEILEGTNPYNPDTDGDGITDGDELTNGSDPLDPCSPNMADVGLYTVNQLSCSNPLGDILVNSPQAGAMYTLVGPSPSISQMLSPSGQFTGFTSGTYNLKVKINNCESAPITIVLNPQPQKPAKPTVSLTAATCSNDGLGVISNYNAAYTYVLTPSNGAMVNASGEIENPVYGTTYTVVAINSNGCSSSASNGFVINQKKPAPLVPEITVGAPTCSANGTASIANHTSGVTYTFLPVGPNVNSSGVINNISYGQTYTLTATNTEGCSVTSSSFSVLPILVKPTLAVTAINPANCGENGTLEFTFTNVADGDYTIDYMGGSFTNVTVTSNTASVSATTGNYVHLTINNGECTSVLGVNTFIIEPNAPDIPLISVTGMNCATQEDGSAQVNNYNASNTYVFSPTGPTIAADGKINGATFDVNYTISIVSGGCSSVPVQFTIESWGNGDCDDDGVSNSQELADGTDPNSLCDVDYVTHFAILSQLWLDADCDNDGLPNGDEITIHNTDPFDPDTDNDGLLDGDEVNIHNTDPLIADTDNDGLLDGEEVNIYGTDPLNADTDGDGLSDGDEVYNYGTNPLSADTDGDGLMDGEEVNVHGTDPLNPDSDGDGLTDGDEVNIHGTNPLAQDTDGDGLIDGAEVNFYNTDPLNPDTDGDGVLDGQEITDGTDPLNPCDYILANQTSPSQAWLDVDCDGDGVSNGQEVADNTDVLNPCEYLEASITLPQGGMWNNADCDGDGIPNGADTNPTDPCSPNNAIVGSFTVNQPSCASAQGGVVVNTPQSGMVYTLTGPSPSTTVLTNSTGNFANLVAGTYGLVASANNCSSTAINIVINPQPQIPPKPTVLVSNSTCENDGQATITNFAISNTYTFTPSDGISVNASGVIENATVGVNYTVVATGPGDCISPTSESFVINEQFDPVTAPIVSVVAPTCTANGTASIDNYVAGSTYTFLPLGPVVNSSGTITNLVLGQTYTTTIVSGNGCLATSESFTVEAMLATPMMPSISIAPATCSANGLATVTNYNANYNYVFTPSAPSIDASGVISGMAYGETYSLSVSNASGCTSNSVNFVVEAIKPTPSTPIVTVIAPECGVNGQAVIENYTTGINYIFTPATGTYVDNNGAIQGADNGTVYTVLASNATGCQSTSVSFEVEAMLVVPTLSVTTVNPIECGENGTINFVFTNVPNGNYTVDYDGGSLSVTVNNNTASLSVPAAVYANLTINNGTCQSAPGVTALVIDPYMPATPAIVSFELNCVTGQDGYAAVGNYNANFTYVFNPVGPSVLSSGLIANAAPGVEYTLKAIDDDCSSLEASFIVEAWADGDCDGDGVSNGDEVTDGTDPLDMCDFVLASQTLTPSQTWMDADCDKDGVTNGDELTDGTDPLEPCDLILASQTVTPGVLWTYGDCDGDGVMNGQEITDGTDLFDDCDFIVEHIDQPSQAWLEADCDGDGVTNGKELSSGTHPLDPCDYKVQDVTLPQNGGWLVVDCDGDGVTNGDEIADGTDPKDPCDLIIANQTVEPSEAWMNGDCDGDGVTNGQELANGSDFLNPCDPNICGLKTPKTFTPNGDGINDYWTVEGLEFYPNNTLVIYNRNGNIVFEAEDYQNNWDGTSTSSMNVGSDELPTGTYYFVLDTKNEAVGVVKGYIFLNR